MNHERDIAPPHGIPRPPLPREGVDRCQCGAKYWDGDACHSCGERWRPWHTCAACGDTDPEFHDDTVLDGKMLCDDCYLEARPNIVPMMERSCRECGRRFDLSRPDDAAEWATGHDCES